MKAISKSIQWNLIGLVVLVALWAGLALTHWLPRPDAIERQSMQILEQPPVAARGKHNAFATVWLLGYDLPAGEREEIAARDVARYAATLPRQRTAFASTLAADHRRDDLRDASSAYLCAASDSTCLDKVRAHADAVRKAVNAHAVTLAQMQSLAAYDHFRGGFVITDRDPVPRLDDPARLLLSDAALHFIDGDAADGLQRACATAGTWRTLSLHTDSLAMLATAPAQYIASARLVADMLGSMPTPGATPPVCAKAFAPIPDPSMDACDAGRAAFTAFTADVDSMFDVGTERNLTAFDRWRWRLLINPQATVALAAPMYATYCSADPAIRQRANAIGWATSPWSLGWQQAFFNPFGPMMAQAEDRRWSYPPARIAADLRDMAAMATLLRSALHGREATSATLPTGVVFDAKARVLRIARDHAIGKPDAWFTIPAPGSRLP